MITVHALVICEACRSWHRVKKFSKIRKETFRKVVFPSLFYKHFLIFEVSLPIYYIFRTRSLWCDGSEGSKGTVYKDFSSVKTERHPTADSLHKISKACISSFFLDNVFIVLDRHVRGGLFEYRFPSIEGVPTGYCHTK